MAGTTYVLIDISTGMPELVGYSRDFFQAMRLEHDDTGKSLLDRLMDLPLKSGHNSLTEIVRSVFDGAGEVRFSFLTDEVNAEKNAVAAPFLADNGSVKYVSITLTDENPELSAEQLFHRTFTELSPSLLWASNAEGQVVYMNNTWEQWTGKTFEQAGDDLLRFIADEDRSCAAEIFEQAFAKQVEYALEFRLADRNGVIRWCHAVGKPYFKNGIFSGFIGSCTDVTERKRTEIELTEKNAELATLFQEFKFVTDFMPQMVWATQPDGFHDFYNKRWYEYTGLTYEDTKDKGWSLVLHPDDYERTWKVWQHSLNTGSLYEIEYRFRRYDGEYRWFLGRAMPLLDEDGNIVKWFGTCTDIHDQRLNSEYLEKKVRERTRDLEALNHSLERSNKELEHFAYIMSHDLQEPLRKIRTFISMLQDEIKELPSSRAAEFMQKINGSATRMTALIKDILSYSQLQVRGYVFERTDLNTVLYAVCEQFKCQLQGKRAQVSLGKLPVIDAIPGQMHQLFSNLMSNAIKFAGGGELKISIDARLASGSCIQIDFHDNGIGFDPEYKDYVFTIFKRLHTRDEYEGTGIGLAICKAIVENHAGTITVDSENGRGAHFIINLPISQPVNAGCDGSEPVPNS